MACMGDRGEGVGEEGEGGRAAQQRGRQRAPEGGSDAALAGVLAMASDDELDELLQVLFEPSLLSPVLKSSDVASARRAYHSLPTRAERELYLEDRLLYLAAGALGSLVTGDRPTYADALRALGDALGVTCDAALRPEELEADLLLHLMEAGGGLDALGAPAGGRAALPVAAAAGGEPAHAAMTSVAEALAGAHAGAPSAAFPLHVHVRDLAPAAAKGCAAAAVTVAASRAACVVAGDLSVGAAGAAAARAAAVRSLSGAAAARCVASAAAPALWLLFSVDAVRAAAGVDVARLTRAVALLAQIRLLHAGGWVAAGDTPGYDFGVGVFDTIDTTAPRPTGSTAF